MKHAEFLVISVLFLTGSALGQTPTKSAETQLADTVADEHQQMAMTDPTLESTFTGSDAAVKFEAGQADKKATAQLSFGGTNIRSAFVKVTAPLDENAPQQSLANLHGLTGASLQVGLWHRLTRVNIDKVDLDEWARLCHEHGDKRDSCNIYKFGDAVASKAIQTTGMTSAAGVAFELSRPKFEFATPTTFTANKEQLREYAGTVAYGIIPNIGHLYFTGLDFRYEVSHEAKPKQQICLPIDATPALRCTTTSVGAPEREMKRIAELRTRWYASGSVIVDVVVARDFNSNATGIDIPIAFSRSGKDNLFNGGVRLGWRSDTKEVTASVFVGAMRDILGSK